MYSYYHSLTYCYIVKVEDSTLYGLQDSSTGRASDKGSKGPEFDSRMVNFKILIILSIYLVLYKFDMKSFKLIRNINYNVINYIFNLFEFSIIDVTVHRLVLYHLYTVLCGVEVRALACRAQHSGFKSLETSKFYF